MTSLVGTQKQLCCYLIEKKKEKAHRISPLKCRFKIVTEEENNIFKFRVNNLTLTAKQSFYPNPKDSSDLMQLGS